MDKSVFYEAFDYAKKYSTCIKVYVGACLVYPDGERVFSANYGEHNCQACGECYKYKVTGIYESNEETRKYCASKHAEINLLDKIDKNKSLDNTELYVTRYPCLNCMRHIADAGIKKIYFCGYSEGTTPEENKEIAEKYGIEYVHISDIDFENDYDKTWWTKQFASKAYDKVKDNKYPIIIPSYNRPNAPALTKGFLSKMTSDKYFPIYVFVRLSQYDDYIKGMSSNKFVNIIGIPDELMIGAGAARRQSLKWLYRNGYKAAFSFDDDLISIGYTEKGFTGNGDLKSSAVPNTDICDTLAMWQICMDYAIDNYDVMISGLMPQGFSWKMEYCWQDQSMLHYRGLPSQAVCINVKGLVENNLIYGDNKDVGHEDIALTIDVLDKNKSVCVFPFMYHSAPPMSIENWGYNSMRERFQDKQNIMRAKYGHLDWVGFKDKRDLPQVTVEWRRYRKSRDIDKYIYNIWNNGKLLEDYSN